MFNIFRREGLSGDVRQITPDDAFKKLSENTEGNTVVIDVRDPNEFSGKLGHIEDAKLVPIKILPLKIEELVQYKDKEIIVVCHSGARSYSACIMFKRHGFDNVYNMKGGMLLWKKAGFETHI